MRALLLMLGGWGLVACGEATLGADGRSGDGGGLVLDASTEAGAPRDAARPDDGSPARDAFIDRDGLPPDAAPPPADAAPPPPFDAAPPPPFDAAPPPPLPDAAPPPPLPDAAPPPPGPWHVPDGDLRREALFPVPATPVLFRFRAFDGDRPAWVSPGAGRLDIQRYVRGPGLNDFVTVRYDGATPGWVGNARIAAGPRGLTIRAWFMATAGDGHRTLFSNTESTRGFSLEIVDGHLQALCSVEVDGAPVRYTVEAPAPVPLNVWHEADARFAHRGDEVEVRLYLDGRLVHEERHPWQGGLFDSVSHPAVGGEPTDNVADTELFQGELYAVVVLAWPVDHDLLATPWLVDGGRYLGMPSYHDYLDERDALEQRITATDRDERTTAHVRVRFGVPLLNDGFVPQGLSVSPDGRRLWLAYYYSSPDAGENPDGLASMVAQIDLTTGTIARLYRLFGRDGQPMTIHAGGLAEAHGYLYLSIGSAILRFDPNAAVEEVAAVPGRSPPLSRLPERDRFAAHSGTSVDYDPHRDALWLNSFRYPGEAASEGVVDRYDLTPDGAVAHPSAEGSDENHVLPVERVQGLVALEEDLCFYLSQSYGDHPSHLYHWCVGGEATTTAVLPAGAEEVDLTPDGTLWTWTESSAAHYQKRDGNPWTTLSPFVLGLRL